MRKKFLSALMLGLLAIGTTSTITSCKDYDGDISSLRNDVTELQSAKNTLQTDVASLKTQLESTKADLSKTKDDLTKTQSQLSSLMSQVATDEASIKANAEAIAKNVAAIAENGKKIQELTATQANLETRITACENAIKDLDTLTKALQENKLDKSEFTAKTQEMMDQIKEMLAKKADITYVDAAVATINGQITALDSKIGDLDKNLTKKIGDEEAARIAAVANLQTQIDALKKYEERIAQNEADITVIYATIKDVYSKIDNLIDKTNAQATSIAANAKSIEDILKEISALKDKVEQAEKDIKANSASINDLTSKMQSINNAVVDLQAQVNVLTVLVKQELRSIVFDPQSYYWGVEATEAFALNYNVYSLEPANADVKEGTKTAKYYSERFPSVAGSTALPVVAEYYMNPSAADLSNAKVNVISDDKAFVISRAAAAGINVASWKAEEGKLKVNLKFNDAAAIQSVPANAKITVFATQATVRSGAKDTTITSDFAAIYKTVAKDLKIAVINPANGTDCADVTNCCTPLHKHPHIYATEQEAADADAQYSVNWNSTLDLAKLVETHYNNGTSYAKFDKLADYGLAYKFELVGYFIGSNKTSESAHAAIKDATLRPQMPKFSEDHIQGTAADYEATAQNETSVGRTPMVRVSLIDTNNNNRVVEYGYIKIAIVKNAEPEKVNPANAIVMKDFDPITYNYECTPKAYTGTLTWAQIEAKIYNLNNMSREDFDANFEKDLNASNEFKQYGVKDGAYVELVNYLGTIVPVNNLGSDATDVAKWTLSTENLQRLLANNNDPEAIFKDAPYKNGDKINVYFRFKSKDTHKYGDIYVQLSTGAITINKPSAIGLTNENKIAENWYQTNSNTAKSGYDEVHAQTVSPEDPYANATADVLDYNIYNVFVGNKITIAQKNPSLDLTANKEFTEGNSLFTKTVIFSDTNKGKTYSGTVDGQKVTYTLDVANGNKSLTVVKKNGVAQSVVTIAKIVANKVKFLHTTEGEAMLNYAAHNALADDVLTAIMQVKAASECFSLPLDVDKWNVRFLRPIDVASKDAQVTDAGTKAQIVNLKDLVAFNDWREVWNPASKDYYTYYNIKSIQVVGAAAGDNIAANVTANLNQAADKFVKLSSVTNNIMLKYEPKSPATPSKNANYGTITYENHGNTVASFDVKIPVVVSYEWGKIYTTVSLHVNGTIGGNSAK